MRNSATGPFLDELSMNSFARQTAGWFDVICEFTLTLDTYQIGLSGQKWDLANETREYLPKPPGRSLPNMRKGRIDPITCRSASTSPKWPTGHMGKDYIYPEHVQTILSKAP
eukprot:6200787-Pleurochrysis_carterae.AAC.1